MRTYYAALAREFPRVVVSRTNGVVNAIGALAFLAVLFSPELAANVAGLNWLGLPRWSAGVVLGVLIVYDLAHANHRIVSALMRERTAAKTDADQLQRRLTVRKTDQTFADQLQEKYDYGVREILNHVLDTPERRIMFTERRDAWESDVLNTMRAHQCTPQEISSVQYLREVPLTSSFDNDPAWNKEKQMVNERLTRLLVVIDRYSETRNL